MINFLTIYMNYELAITALNMFTDILLFAIALRLFLKLHLSRLLRSLIAPLVLVFLTLGVAAARLTLTLIHITASQASTSPVFTGSLTLVTLNLLMELDSFLALFVVYLPGLRVWRRTNEERTGEIRENPGFTAKGGDQTYGGTTMGGGSEIGS